MPKLPYTHVDAFADRPFAGNQAAVMPLDTWLPDDVLQAIGAENNFAETAFTVPDETGAADYELRWFTPTDEVAMCGHATLAAGHVLLAQSGGDRVTFRTRKAGVLEVQRADDGYALSLPVTLVEQRDNAALLSALGCEGTVYESISGAEATAIILVEDEAALRAIRPDMRALGGIDLMAICTAAGSDTDVVSRVFVPAWGVDEDSVTGSAHAALAPFWTERLGRREFTAHQASLRGGDLTCRLEGEGKDARAWLGGPCVTVVEGVFHLPD
ncbi:Trans-2,3-dihydro-3-hydroxyanthranilate isomerase [Alteripontixanthobacter maritimus]|uniref:Trans-2,3-dihydro-3-hydroxyanthranilate isomerase n=1 Tax=Alteripontixanthobacter maritimus TaxID=2161824 RepID=A0A369QFM2_9SPHN|nr:PhzF family phenazine biosynthesis protein [Alteripontixanthobacter maritimus]RDC61098.1 Trans-2,3-dihydro-3-hydroxyanthranilate isomerase [Alteripontixanthobacter maritimus]